MKPFVLITMIAVVIVTFSLPSYAQVAADASKMTVAAHKTCEHSGDAWHKSATRVMLSAKDGEKESQFCFTGLTEAWRQLEKKYGKKPDLTQLMVVDYPAYGEGEIKMIDGMSAFYLVGLEEADASFDPLNIIAFNSKDEAKGWAAEHGGGKLSKFDDVVKQVNAYWAKQDEAAAEGAQGTSPTPPACSS